MLKILYETFPGRVILKFLTNRKISELVGSYMDSKYSKWLIPIFMKMNHINPDEYIDETYENFNDCFSRHIKPELRPIDYDPTHFISPCDGLLSAYKITGDLVIPVKQSKYRIPDLLRSKKIASLYEDGTILVFRLCVNHYHRYAYPDNAKKANNRFIPGVLHTVQPIALRHTPVFTENCREYTLMDTENFGKIIQMEVGAMLVGKIKNHHEARPVKRGEEKGCFLYGGSTIIVLLQKDKVNIDNFYFEATKREIEVPVKLGECLGQKM